MKIDREVIIDLLPVYFSGDASEATSMLVQEYFREHPEEERLTRHANRPLEGLKLDVPSGDSEKEKAALKRARDLVRYRQQMSVLLFISIAYSVFSSGLIVAGYFAHRLMHGNAIAIGFAFTLCALAMWFAYGVAYFRQRMGRAATAR